MNSKISARASGQIEYADLADPDRLEQILRSSSEQMPPAIRGRLQARLTEQRARTGQPAIVVPADQPLDTSTSAGRLEHTERLLAEVQAERLLEGI
jgi:hypothetical protein